MCMWWTEADIIFLSSSFFRQDLWLTLGLNYFTRLTSSFFLWWVLRLTLELDYFARVTDLQTTGIRPSLSVLGLQVHYTLPTLAFKWMSRVRLRFLCLWSQPFMSHLCRSHFTFKNNTVFKYCLIMAYFNISDLISSLNIIDLLQRWLGH